MIEPSKVTNEALRNQDQNFRFRLFLKARADNSELDDHFLRLHNELFSGYDCRKCNNCCKEYTVFLEPEEIGRIADFLELPQNEFVAQYLAKADDDSYRINQQPCGFLGADGKCRIYECRPAVCAGFPFTNQPGRLGSMLSILEFAETCPVVFEILEKLKEIYHFRDRRR